jgi:Domain of unknown function (DUF6259)/Glycosyl hydrolase family 30 beta sandwich domain
MHNQIIANRGNETVMTHPLLCPHRVSPRLLLPAFCLTMFASGNLSHAQSNQDWLSGQDSPVHDSDLRTPASGKVLSLEDGDVRIGIDAVSGALIELVNKHTGWQIQRTPQLAESFRIFAPTPERSYSPILGAKNLLSSFEKSADGRSLTLVWSSLQSEYRGKLDITLTAKVALDGPDVNFDMRVRNNSGWTITSVDWPILGALGTPQSAAGLTRLSPSYGSGRITSLSPNFQNERGYYGTNYPIQMGAGRYNLILAGQEGLYLGGHDTSAQEVVDFAYELKPGYSDSFDERVPAESDIRDHPARIVASVEHFPFVPSGATAELARVVLSPFSGDWHHGADVYRRWHATWFHRPVTPAWAQEVSSWQQMQINSAEDDLRTTFNDLPRRAEQAAQAGINAIQLVGWNDGGQDRGNPSHDSDQRIGTREELKNAIQKIEAMGVHVILFNKYTWVDTSSPLYKSLIDHVAHDPNGQPYIYHGYEYQTPEQLADMNTRRLAVACTPDPFWLDLSSREFRKSIDLGATGILYDEVQHHGGADYCFSHQEGQLVARSLWAGDSMLGQRFRDIIESTVGANNFLMAGEAPYDLETRYYSLFYFRITPGHIPVDRYNDPFLPMMIAATGFDDREMINEALRYRYIISYEPFNFKGNLSDFPETLAYGLKMDAFRRKYKDYLWNAEFRDDQDAAVKVNGMPYISFSTFRRNDGKRAVVIVNEGREPVAATVELGNSTRELRWGSPEEPEWHAVDDSVSVPARSAVVVFEP